MPMDDDETEQAGTTRDSSTDILTGRHARLPPYRNILSPEGIVCSTPHTVHQCNGLLLTSSGSPTAASCLSSPGFLFALTPSAISLVSSSTSRS
ncbi:hypothetical protein J6590_041383 [Homalodisca vitripennis]|nr:hypothetical protein J6590_041383 [Homalodisca vitripennis]